MNESWQNSVFVYLIGTVTSIICLQLEIRKNLTVSAITHHVQHTVSASESDEKEDLVIEEIGDSSAQIKFERSECGFLSGRRSCLYIIP